MVCLEFEAGHFIYSFTPTARNLRSEVMVCQHILAIPKNSCKEKNYTQIYFKLNPICFKASPTFSLLWPLQGSRSFFFIKRNWQGYIGSQPAVAVIKNGNNLFWTWKRGIQKIKLEKNTFPKLPILPSTKLPALWFFLKISKSFDSNLFQKT